MYRKTNQNQLKFEKFYLPFSGNLRSDNRWVILSKQIPWVQIEKEYSDNFSESNAGCPAKSARIALGALIIKERLGITPLTAGCSRYRRIHIFNTFLVFLNTRMSRVLTIR